MCVLVKAMDNKGGKIHLYCGCFEMLYFVKRMVHGLDLKMMSRLD